MVEMLEKLLYDLAVLVIPVVGAFIVQFIRTKTNQLKNKNNNEKVNHYIDLAENVIETSVKSVFQTYVDSLKKSGQFDSYAQNEAFTMAKDNITKILNDASKQALTEVYGDLDEFLKHAIEKYVSENKLSITK